MKKRSTQLELMDQDSSFYTHDEYVECLKILFKINRLLGFFQSTVRVLSRFPHDASLIDVGCGGGLFLLHLSQRYPNMRLTGIDVSELAVTTAQKEQVLWAHHHKAMNVDFQQQHQMEFDLPASSVDCVLTTLVCHHMNDEALVVFLQRAYSAARRAVIINDLHRHRLAYWVYYCFSSCLFRNRLITHDGLISIQRGFKRAEWHRFLKQANISNYSIRWAFPFRWRVVLWKS
jgi:2-polyprenyl-3-methyl-5-hydroxy-6-metoxy-1,4-benzoquinol methylase